MKFFCLSSLLIARIQRTRHIDIHKRHLGKRLDPTLESLPSDLNSILDYDDIHLPNQQDTWIFNNAAWSILNHALRKLFHEKTIQLLARYHQQTIHMNNAVSKNSH
jgi:hypothetical protein